MKYYIIDKKGSKMFYKDGKRVSAYEAKGNNYRKRKQPNEKVPVKKRKRSGVTNVTKKRIDDWRMGNTFETGDGNVRKEINNYNLLKGLQGRVIPYVYSHDTNHIIIDKLKVNVLYEKLRTGTRTEKRALLLQIKRVVKELHIYGYCHNDLAFQNMGISTDNRVLLFDLEDVEPIRIIGSFRKDARFITLIDMLIEYVGCDSQSDYTRLLQTMYKRGSDR